MTKNKGKSSASSTNIRRKSQRYRDSREKVATIKTQTEMDAYAKKKFTPPNLVRIKQSSEKGRRKWIVVDYRNKIIAQKPFVKGENLRTVTPQFNKRTLSFDPNILSFNASILRSTKNGKYTIRKIMSKKEVNVRRKYQIQITARCTIYPKARMSKPIDGGIRTGFSGFVGSDNKKLNDAKNMIKAQLDKEGLKKNYEDVVVFSGEKIAYQYYYMSKKRPIGAPSFG